MGIRVECRSIFALWLWSFLVLAPRSIRNLSGEAVVYLMRRERRKREGKTRGKAPVDTIKNPKGHLGDEEPPRTISSTFQLHQQHIPLVLTLGYARYWRRVFPGSTELCPLTPCCSTSASYSMGIIYGCFSNSNGSRISRNFFLPYFFTFFTFVEYILRR